MAAMSNSPPDSAQLIGAYFVEQYYAMLHHSPYGVLQFYYDISKLGRPEEDGSMTITTTMKGIKKKIVAFNYSDFRAEIKSVDAQDSFNGGVQVVVTGSLTGRDNNNGARNFTQVFFLAPQDSGYFVLNDMFRYVDSVTDDVFPKPAAPAEDQKQKRKKNKKKKLTSHSNQQPYPIQAEGDDEDREVVKQHQDSMKSYLQKAVSGVFRIQSDSVKSYLKKVVSRVLRIRSKSDREADERASLDIFAEKNKSMRNMITFDLHGQKVKQAMKLLKIHLLFGAYYRSVRSFKVITGRGKHSVDGMPRLKNSIINLLKKEGIAWREEENNPGMLRIELKEHTNFSFLHSGSSSHTK